MSWFSIHNHSHFSNFRLKDSVNKPEDIVDEAVKKGLSGICLTDHETLAGAVKFDNYYKQNKDKLPEGFKISVGNEIYLISKENARLAKEENESIKFYHFLLLAKNQKGWEFLKKQTSQAWNNSFFHRGMERVPTYYEDLEGLMKDYKGDVVASSACLGGHLPQLILQLNNAEINNQEIITIKKEINTYINYMKKVFGEDDFYLELQPSENEEQKIVNERMLSLSKAYNLKCIVSTDAHYLNKDQATFHEKYLTAQEGEREVKEFYSSTYIFSYDELLEHFSEDILNELVKNTNEIKDKIEEIEFGQLTKIPLAHIPEYSMNNLFVDVDKNKYPYIHELINSDNEIDKYYAHLIANGMNEKNEDLDDTNLSRINIELNEILSISKQLGQPMSSYFVLMKEFVDLMWTVSLVGVARGSASCYYTNYLLDIVQINPIKYNLPHWRFLTRERPEFPDIDVDAESSKRQAILDLVKLNYGHENVLNIGTYTTEGSRSASLTACRALGIDPDTAQNITNAIPSDKNVPWDLRDVFYGNEKENRKPNNKFKYMVNEYDGLEELMVQSQGLVSGRGQHPSGLVVFPKGYTEQNAMMKTTSQKEITQFDAEDTEFMGAIKYDFLSINALDRIRASMDLLLESGKIEWQGSLKSTYNKYLHPDVLEMEQPKMFDLLYTGDIIAAFQFETITGRATLEKVHARNFEELSAANSLMRLSVDGGEQPVDRYIRYKNNPVEWEQDMVNYGLNKEERNVLHEHLDSRYGVCDTQELLMMLSMDERISNYNLLEANKLRKAVAKIDNKLQEQQREYFIEKCKNNGTSEIMAKYIWYECFGMQLGYAFSLPHIAGYTMILMIEMNIAYRFGSIYWKTANLNVESGLIGETESTKNYGTMSKAIENFKEDITPPSLSKSSTGFKPNEETQKILFGFKPINQVNVEIAEQIINNRPYKDIQDFYTKNVTNGLITDKKMVLLIKSGLFDEINKNRKQVMINFINYITEVKDKLTMAQINKIRKDVPVEFNQALEIYDFRQMLKKEKEHNAVMTEFMDRYNEKVKEFVTPKYPDTYTFNDNGDFIIDDYVFEKYYKKETEALSEWLKTIEATNIEAKYRKQEFWIENCLGSTAHWEMESINSYLGYHELDEYNLERYFEIANFNNLTEDPVAIKWNKGRNGKSWPVFKAEVIAGTVVDSDIQKGIAVLITQYGVVQVRIGKGRYQYYNEKIMVGSGSNRKNIDDSWFKRGTLLVIVGYRRGNDFIANARNSNYEHSVMKIVGKKQDEIFIQMDKKNTN